MAPPPEGEASMNGREGGGTRVTRVIVISAVLGLVAMLRYPGGTPLDRSTRGYSLTQNFLSDLGMTVAYDGRPNLAGALCFVASLCVLVVGLGGAFVGLARRYAVSPAARRFAYAAGAVGLLACVAFIGVAFTPENRVMGLHVRLTLLAFRLLPLAALLLTLAARASGVAAPRAVAAWASVTALLAAYAALLTWGPALGTSLGLTTYVIAQKIVAIAVPLAIAYQSVAASRRTHAP